MSDIDWSQKRTALDKIREQADAANALWKSERAAAVSQIIVEVDGLVFDGDELSQTRMARAVAAADSLEQRVAWTLADNTVAFVTATQLKKALYLAGVRQTAIWSAGRPVT